MYKLAVLGAFLVLWFSGLSQCTTAHAGDEPPSNVTSDGVPKPDDPKAVDKAMCHRLIDAALRDAQLILWAEDGASAYCEIALVQAMVGDTAGASQSLELAKATAARVCKESQQDSLFHQIALAYAKSRHIPEATALASSYQVYGYSQAAEKKRADLYCEILIAHVKRGEIRQARAIAAQLSSELESAYCALAIAQANAGDIIGANATMDRLILMSGKSTNSYKRGPAYAAIVAAQMKAGDIAGAKATVDKCGSRDVCREMAIGYVKMGDFARAKATAAQLDDSRERAMFYTELAVAQAESEDLVAAQATAEQISDSDDKNSVWLQLALVQARAGDLAGAKLMLGQSDIDKTTERYTEQWVWVYCETSIAQAKAKDEAGARQSLDLATTMAGKYYRRLVSAYGRIVAAYAKRDQIAEAIRFSTDASDDPRERCSWLVKAVEELVQTD